MAARARKRKAKKGKSSSAGRWRVAGLVLLAGALLVLGFQVITALGPGTMLPVAAPEDEPPSRVVALSEALQRLGIDPASVTRRVASASASVPAGTESWEIRVPHKVSLVECNVAMTRAASELGLVVSDAWEHGASKRAAALTLMLTEAGVGVHWAGTMAAGASEAAADMESLRKPLFEMTFFESHPPERARVAVVIDDFGYSWNETVERFLDFSEPLTFAVLPGLRNSPEFAQVARDRGFEVILHMPMEPERYPQQDPGHDAIMLSDRPATIRARLRRALESVGTVRGLSNHMGSLVTSDEDVMRVVVDESARNDLFLLDSRTTPRSVVCREARRQGMQCVENRLFLDDVRSVDAIGKRLERAIEIAMEMEEVVVIGHAYAETYEVLSSALPGLEERGIRLVSVSDLLSPAQVF